MRPLRRLLRRATSWIRRRRDEERLQAEIEEHLAMQTDENVRAGLTPSEARRQAVLKFGAVAAVKEHYRDQKGLPMLETLLHDLRHALRGLRKAPAFTTTVVLTVALGIGATTAIFTLVHAVVFKSLAVANPGELYRLGKETHCCDYGGYTQARGFSIVSYDLYKYFRDHTTGFAELAAFESNESLFGVRRTGRADAAQSYRGEFVSGNYFSMFGIQAYSGRALTPSDDQPGAPPVAVMSYRLWQAQYGSDPAVIGSVFELDNKPVTVVGITPPAFFGDTLRETTPDFFLPIATQRFIETDIDRNRPDDHWLDLIGRIRPGITRASVEAQMRMELKAWLRLHWGDMSDNERALFPEQTVFLSPGGAGITSMREDYEHWLQILMMASGFVLLIVCANVGNLMLVRGMERRRTTSLSMALGARAPRLVRQALTESILLSLLGGTIGLAIAYAGTRVILRFAFPAVTGSATIPIDASPSVSVLVFAFGVSLVTGIAFGIAPAWMTARVDPIEALRGAGRSTARTGSTMRKTLVVFQAALSLVLLSAAGLLTAVLHHLEDQNFGFEQDRRTVVSIDPLLAGYRIPQLTPLYRRIHDSLAAIPGVSAVALCLYSPQSGDSWNASIFVDGHPLPALRDDNSATWERVTPGYFDAVGNPIIGGRGIGSKDTASSRPVAVINEAFARKFFKNVDPIGKFFGRDEPQASRQYEVVGIAKDERHVTYDLDKPIRPFFFLSEAQFTTFPSPANTKSDLMSHFLHDIVIVTSPGASLSRAQVNAAMAHVDPNLPVIGMRSLREQVAAQFTQQRLIARLASLFGVLSLALASIGWYGVTAYNAGRRVGEIGVRMAMGADRGDILGLIVRGAFMLIAFGLILGLPLAFAADRFLGNQLYGMSPYNPAVLLAAVVALGLSAFAASLIPAFRATLISPLEALRAD